MSDQVEAKFVEAALEGLSECWFCDGRFMPWRHRDGVQASRCYGGCVDKVRRRLLAPRWVVFDKYYACHGNATVGMVEHQQNGWSWAAKRISDDVNRFTTRKFRFKTRDAAAESCDEWLLKNLRTQHPELPPNNSWPPLSKRRSEEASALLAQKLSNQVGSSAPVVSYLDALYLWPARHANR